MGVFVRSLPWWMVPVVAACGGSGGGGGPAPTPPNFALSFDGANDLARFPFPVASTSTFTVEAWIRPTTLLPASPTFAGIVNVAGAHLLSLNSDQSSFAHSVSTPNSLAAFSPAGTLQAGVWQHVAGVYDGAQIRLYLNGTVVGSAAQSGAASAATAVFVGAFSGFYDGLIDEVRLWSTARSQAEIQANMAAILTGLEAGLLAYWRFEEGAGQALLDTTPNDRDGTLGADAAVASDDPTRVTTGAPVS